MAAHTDADIDEVVQILATAMREADLDYRHITEAQDRTRCRPRARLKPMGHAAVAPGGGIAWSASRKSGHGFPVRKRDKTKCQIIPAFQTKR